jgi:hypothetical protein
MISASGKKCDCGLVPAANQIMFDAVPKDRFAAGKVNITFEGLCNAHVKVL